MARNRVIYQSQALFIAPSSTGAQVSGVEAFSGPKTEGPYGPSSLQELASGVSLLKKMDRIQNCNFNFTLNRTDINEFGKLARIDTLVTEPPTVGLDFSYYVTDGYNERLMGFNFVSGIGDGNGDNTDTNMSNIAQSVSGLLQDLQGNNYYILTVEDGEDVVGNQSDVLTPTSTVVSIGNGFITDYSFEAAVGGLPTATITVEAFNIRTDAGVAPIEVVTPNGDLNADAGMSGSFISGNSPAVNLFVTPAQKYTDVSKAYKIDYRRNYTGAKFADLGLGVTGFTTGDSTVSALRPGDITLDFPAGNGGVALQGNSQAHIQSFSFSIPLTRTILQRLGSVFGYTRVVDVPINMELSISAVVSELQNINLFDTMADTSTYNFRLTLNDSNQTTPTPKMSYEIRNAQLVSETYSEAIGDNQTVDITYTVQLGGANDTTAGVFMSGSANSTQIDNIVKDFFKLGTGKLG